MVSAKWCIFAAILVVQSEIAFIYFSLYEGNQVRVIVDDQEERSASKRDRPALAENSSGIVTYGESARQVRQYMKEAMFRYDRGRQLPLMKLTAAQMDNIYRIALGRKWLKSQRLVVAATVRNSMNGLESSVTVMKQLSDLFHSVTAVFVENDSTDATRSYLHELTKHSSAKFRVHLLGCGSVNSPDPCHLNISYGSSGHQHRSGHREQAGRSLAEESIDRGLVMAALRNMYLSFIYANIQADLLLVLEADLRWSPWSMDAVAQGLYYFRAKPQLDSLCAFNTYSAGRQLHDPCTLIFFHNKRFYVDAGETSGPFVDRIGNPNQPYKDHFFPGRIWALKHIPMEPVKVASCFQGAAFYRMSSLRAASAFYRYSEGEWHCEHSTLSLKLRENYLDLQMRLSLVGHASG